MNGGPPNRLYPDNIIHPWWERKGFIAVCITWQTHTELAMLALANVMLANTCLDSFPPRSHPERAALLIWLIERNI